MEIFKNKKFIFFVGLFHHLKKMTNISDALNEYGANIIYVTAQNHNGCAPNINFEATLIENEHPYVELTEYLNEKIVRKISTEKKIILQKTRDSFFKKKYDSEILQYTVEKDLMFALVDGIEINHLIPEMLQKEKPDAVFILHEGNFWTKSLSAFCNKFNIPIFSFQEGIYYDDCSVNLLKNISQYSSRVFLWGTDAEIRIKKAGGRKDLLIVTGAPHLDKLKDYNQKRIVEIKKKYGINLRSQIVTFITPRLFNYPISYTFLECFIKYILKHADIQFIIKFHPADPEWMLKQTKEYIYSLIDSNSLNSNIYFKYKEGIEDLIAISDLILSYGTTAGGETLAFKKPLIEINWEKKNYNLSFTNKRVSEELVEEKDFKKINKILAEGIDSEIKTNMEKFVYKNFYKIDGKATKRVLEEVIKYMKNKCSKNIELQDMKPLCKINKNGSDAKIDISVIIPTYNRKSQLEKTILAYKNQSLSPDNFELIIIDDGSDDGTDKLVANLNETVAFNIIYRYQKNKGPAAARNWGINIANAVIVLITGDDIVPAETLLEKHLRVHRQQPEEIMAVLGHIDWYPKITMTPLMYYLTNVGGEQFAFHLIENNDNAGFRFFYTSNISLKRKMLLKNGLFDTFFAYAAYEDIELGYRLENKGLKIIYQPEAIAYHNHPMNIESFCERQYKAGRMAVVFAEIHPELARLIGTDQKIELLPNTVIKDLINGVNELEKLNIEKLKNIKIEDSHLNEKISFFLYTIYRNLLTNSYVHGIMDHKNNVEKNNIYNPFKNHNEGQVINTRTYGYKANIVIVTYNSANSIRQCLDSVIKYTDTEKSKIVVVDNRSSDETRKILSAYKEHVFLILNDDNFGFSAACNQGIKYLKSEYVVLLNPDTVVTQRWLEKLLAHFKPNVGAVGPTSDYVAGLQRIQNYLPKRLSEINDFSSLSKILENNIHKYVETKLLIGFCIAISSEAIQKVGLLDEALFLGNDDLDFSWRLRLAGYRLLVATDTFIHHAGQVSFKTEKKSKTDKLVSKSTEILYKKLLDYYGVGNVPDPRNLWGIDWFKPINGVFNTGSDIHSFRRFTGSLKVSIIILTLNALEYTKRCVESILENTETKYEIIFIDNGSTDGTCSYLSKIAEEKNFLKLILNSKNIGFAAGNNQGMEIARGDYILFLNNDVVVTPGWLERLISSADKRKEIGIVGPRSNYVSGKQLVQVVDYDQDSLDGLKRFSEDFANKNRDKASRLLRVVGFCMLVKRAVIDKIGGMDHQYGFGNFEDDDFSIRAALAGFESWMVEDCFVHHFGSRTFIGEKIDYRKSLLQNWKIFKEKWGLPYDLPYGSPYSISQMKVNGFNPQVHHIPLSGYNNYTMQNWSENVSTVEQEYRTMHSSNDMKNIIIAIEKLKRFANKYQNYAPVYNDLGVLYYKNGDNKSALEHYRIALKHDKNNILFRKNLADFLAVAFAEYEEALQHYVTVLASDPKDVEALLATGHICARLERYDDAAEFYEKVLETEPHNSDAQTWLAKMREKSTAKCLEGDMNRRYRALLSEINQEDLAGAIHKIENFIEIYPKHGQAHNDLGVLYYKNISKTKVLAHYLKAVELEPENVTFRKNLADFLYVEEGRVEEALENYAEILRIKPDDIETLLITGHICTAIERFDDAISFYNKVLNLEPKNLDAHQNMEALKKRQISMLNQEAMDEEKPDNDTEINQAEPQATVDEAFILQDGVVEELINKAELLFQQERIDQAVDTMLKAIAVNPSDGRTYVELAGQLVNHGRHENAFEVLAEMPAKQPVAVATQKLVVEGYAEEGMGNYAAAKKCSESVLDCEPENAKAMNLDGILAYRNGDKTTAEQHFKRAIELASEYGEPHTNLGALVWETSEPKMALEHYERGFSISPTDIDVANAYHEVVTATGDFKRAEKVARDALKRYPQCRKVHYLLIDTLIRQEKTEDALKELEAALSTLGIDEGLLETALAFRNRVGKTKKTGSAKKPDVSLCMIVKDEETNLARCLASVKPIVDEMVVVDTGSTDRTKGIAEFFDA